MWQGVEVALGLITHERPQGLLRVLQSFAALRIPSSVSCRVIIVENADEDKISPLLADRLRDFPFPINVAVERERGIPFARNRVLDLAIESGADFLTFVDDDQIVHKDWLAMLVATMTLRDLDLVGGPRDFAAEDKGSLTGINRAVLRRYQDDALRRRATGGQRVSTDAEGTIPIYTNNWILRLARQKDLKTRFDETLYLSGGSDTQFWKDFVEAGGRSGWSGEALTTELWPNERLTLSYHFARTRAQRTVGLVREEIKITPYDILRRVWDLVRIVTRKAIRGPYFQGHVVTTATAQLALLSGEIDAYRRRNARLYKAGGRTGSRAEG